MEVLQDNMVVAILGKGDLVGCDIPATLTTESIIKSSSDVKALTYCDLKSIHIIGLLDVLKLYPEFSETFCTEIIHDLTFNLREGYENENDGYTLRGAHSLTLPSISEDDEKEDDEEEGEDGDHDDDSGSGSPPPSPPPLSILSSGRRKGIDSWNHMHHKTSDCNAPLLHSLNSQNRRPGIRFSPIKSVHIRRPAEDSKDERELTRSSVDRLDSQMTALTQDVNKMSGEIKLILAILQKISLKYPPSDDGEKLENQAPKCSKDSNRCPGTVCAATVGTQSHCTITKLTLGTQTERFLLEDLLTKLTDSGSPPPNSGYSSSSSNEEKVRYLAGLHWARNEDSESVSDDSVLKNSLTIQSITSSRDVSPFKGSRNSWGTHTEPTPSPLPSPRPLFGALQCPTSTQSVQSESQCAIDIESGTNPPKRKMSTEL